MKLFVTDFDRTLFVDRKISLEDIKSIREWQSQGNLFVIATGRDVYSISERLELYNIKPDYLICNNGAALFDKEMNLILSKFIEKDTVIKVIDYIYNNYEGGVSLSEVNSKISILPKKGTSCEKDFKKAIEYKDIDTEEIGQVYQIHKRFENEDYTKGLENDLNSKFKNSITAYANSHNVDVVANGVNKSSTIKYLNENLSDIDEIITIGDSYNDLQMILDYDGYMVFSGKESLKKMLKNICTSVSECLSIISNGKKEV